MLKQYVFRVCDFCIKKECDEFFTEKTECYKKDACKDCRVGIFLCHEDGCTPENLLLLLCASYQKIL